MSGEDSTPKRRPYAPPLIELVDLAVRGSSKRKGLLDLLRGERQAQTVEFTAIVESVGISGSPPPEPPEE